jgi:dihydrofolate reductase
VKISIIVSMDEKRGIGKKNALMWHIPGELPRFKQITTGHPVIMGRKTFESIGRLLPNRVNIVITRDLGFKIDDSRLGDNLIIVDSLDEALIKAEESIKNPLNTKYEIPNTDEVFVIGGGQIYKQAMEKGIVDRLYLTIVEGDFGADTFFPDYSNFTKVISEESHSDGEYKYKFLTLENNL